MQGRYIARENLKLLTYFDIKLCWKESNIIITDMMKRLCKYGNLHLIAGATILVCVLYNGELVSKRMKLHHDQSDDLY